MGKNMTTMPMKKCGFKQWDINFFSSSWQKF